MNAPVVSITTASTVKVGLVRQTRKPYRTVRLTQMKWNGTVSHEEMMSIAARLASENSTQATSIHRSRFGHSSVSGRIEPVSHPTDRGDRVWTELRAEAANVDIDHVRSGVEVVTPDRREQPFLRHRASCMPHQLLEEQELSVGERDRPATVIDLAPDQVERRRANHQLRLVGSRCGSQARPHPGEQLLERERLREVVLRAELERSHLRSRVAERREDEDGLGGLALQDLLEHRESVDVRHHQIEDEEVIGP